MWRFASGLLVALLLIPTALAGADSDAVRAFGLAGSWAVDCKRPHAANNPYLRFEAPDQGSPTKTLSMGGSDFDATVAMVGANVVGSDRLAYTETDRFGTYAIVLLMREDRLRSVESTEIRSGRRLIVDGKSTGSAPPPPLFQRCGGR